MLQWPSDTLVVFERGEGGGDLWTLNLSDPDNPTAEPYLSAEANLRRISVSPDGTLAVYRSNESGANQIYVRSFPVQGERTIVSQGGGTVPFWSPGRDSITQKQMEYLGWRATSPELAAVLAKADSVGSDGLSVAERQQWSGYYGGQLREWGNSFYQFERGLFTRDEFEARREFWRGVMGRSEDLRSLLFVSPA